MSKEFHYVVVFDSETEQFRMDYETQSSKFHDAPVFDSEQGEGEWVALDAATTWEDDQSLYSRAADALDTMMTGLKLTAEEK
jgi:hypothetical protein